LAVAVSLAVVVLLAARETRAGRYDPSLLNLCTPHAPAAGTLGAEVSECSWVSRDAQGNTTVTLDPDATSRFRSLMSELGVVLAPQLNTPADTLGFGGFQFSVEVNSTQISRDKAFWNGVSGVDPANAQAWRPSSSLTTVGGYVRKGLWFPFPGLEWGVGAMNLVGSSLWSLQAYAKFALLEGFNTWALPSLAVRGSIAEVVGSSQVDLTIGGVDVLISKPFSLAGTARLEPFAGWNLLMIQARSAVIDATPGCDAYALRLTSDPAQTPGHCAPAQAGTWKDLDANFSFPRQDLILRHRLFGGFKIKLSTLFLVGQYALTTPGTSRDERDPTGPRDQSGRQQSFSLAGGLDF
jgi:hypothetical protein